MSSVENGNEIDLKELQEQLEKTLVLLKGPSPGTMTWHQALGVLFRRILKLLAPASEDKNLAVVRVNVLCELVSRGWRVVPTSCVCGGIFSIMRPRVSGSMKMVGCVCHNLPGVDIPTSYRMGEMVDFKNKMKDYNLCPKFYCGKKAVKGCKCSHANMICPDGHGWYIDESGAVAIGQASHSS